MMLISKGFSSPSLAVLFLLLCAFTSSPLGNRVGLMVDAAAEENHPPPARDDANEEGGSSNLPPGEEKKKRFFVLYDKNAGVQTMLQDVQLLTGSETNVIYDFSADSVAVISLSEEEKDAVTSLAVVREVFEDVTVSLTKNTAFRHGNEDKEKKRRHSSLEEGTLGMLRSKETKEEAIASPRASPPITYGPGVSRRLQVEFPSPGTGHPSTTPSIEPSEFPSTTPSGWPSEHPYATPSVEPSEYPSATPLVEPSGHPSVGLTAEPSDYPSTAPTYLPSVLPTASPSEYPTDEPTPTNPTLGPSDMTVPGEISSMYGIQMVQAPEVWAAGYQGEGITVCLVDSGIDMWHPDFDHDLVDGSITGYPWDVDMNGHGTHVAGTVAASGNGFGVVGVAPKATIHAVNVFGDDTETTYVSNILNALMRCADAEADVINMSLSGSQPWNWFAEQKLQDLHDQGIILVAPAGNTYGSSLRFPAVYESVISVGSVTSLEVLSSFSTRNYGVDLAAPGSEILSTLPATPPCFGCSSGYDFLNPYGFLSGTSMASPHVAGVAALLLNAFPTATADEMRNAMFATAKDKGTPGRDDSFGHGIVKAFDAFQLLHGGTNISVPTQAPTALTLSCITPSFRVLYCDDHFVSGSTSWYNRFFEARGVVVNFYSTLTSCRSALSDDIVRDETIYDAVILSVYSRYGMTIAPETQLWSRRNRDKPVLLHDYYAYFGISGYHHSYDSMVPTPGSILVGLPSLSVGSLYGTPLELSGGIVQARNEYGYAVVTAVGNVWGLGVLPLNIAGEIDGWLERILCFDGYEAITPRPTPSPTVRPTPRLSPRPIPTPRPSPSPDSSLSPSVVASESPSVLYPTFSPTQPIVGCDTKVQGSIILRYERDEYQFSPPPDVHTVEINTCSDYTNFDTVIVFFSETSSSLRSNDDSCGVRSRLTVPLLYLPSISGIYVRGYWSSAGDYELEIKCYSRPTGAPSENPTPPPTESAIPTVRTSPTMMPSPFESDHDAIEVKKLRVV